MVYKILTYFSSVLKEEMRHNENVPLQLTSKWVQSHTWQTIHQVRFSCMIMTL